MSEDCGAKISIFGDILSFFIAFSPKSFLFMYPPLRQAEWIKFIGLLITSENFCTLKIQKKFGDAFYPRTLTLSRLDLVDRLNLKFIRI